MNIRLKRIVKPLKEKQCVNKNVQHDIDITGTETLRKTNN
jgi:hypothetical protein